MSQSRKVTLGLIDLDSVESSCRKRGLATQRNMDVKMYYDKQKCDLVVDKTIGFSRDATGIVTAHYDDMYTVKYATIIANYIEDVGDLNGYSSYKVSERSETKDFVTLRLEV